MYVACAVNELCVWHMCKRYMCGYSVYIVCTRLMCAVLWSVVYVYHMYYAFKMCVCDLRNMLVWWLELEHPPNSQRPEGSEQPACA